MNISTIARQYVHKKALIDSLQKEVDQLKGQIIQYHNGRDIVSEAGIESKIIHGTKSTLQKAEVEKLLGREIPASCFKFTPYEQLRVKLVA